MEEFNLFDTLKSNPLDVFVLLKFFTTWCVIIVAFHEVLHKYIEVLFLTAIVFLIGSYVSHVKPKYFILKLTNQTIYIEGFSKLLIDLIHVSLFVFAIRYYGRYYLQCKKHWLPLTNTVMLLWLYLLLVRPDEIYDIDESDFVILFVIAITLYLSILYFVRM